MKRKDGFFARWQDVATEDLRQELLRREAAQLDGKILTFERQIEQAMIQHHDALTSEVLRQRSEQQTGEPRPCPKCNAVVPLRMRGRV